MATLLTSTFLNTPFSKPSKRLQGASIFPPLCCLIEIMSFYLYGPGTIGIEKLPYLDRISITQNHSAFENMGANMTKDKPVEKIREILKTDNNLDFLLELKKQELEGLVACIRDRVDRIIQIETT